MPPGALKVPPAAKLGMATVRLVLNLPEAIGQATASLVTARLYWLVGRLKIYTSVYIIGP